MLLKQTNCAPQGECCCCLPGVLKEVTLKAQRLSIWLQWQTTKYSEKKTNTFTGNGDNENRIEIVLFLFRQQRCACLNLPRGRDFCVEQVVSAPPNIYLVSWRRQLNYVNYTDTVCCVHRHYIGKCLCVPLLKRNTI